MKHSLIILIYFLLLSSPVIGNNHKGETLFRWETSCCYEWKGFGDKETNPKYQGEVKNGKPHGFGILIFPNGLKYVGEFKDGLSNGQGTSTYDGSKYVGEFKDGKQHGKGIDFDSDLGMKYEGEFKNGKIWNGTMSDTEGNIFNKWVNGVGEDPYLDY